MKVFITGRSGHKPVSVESPFICSLAACMEADYDIDSAVCGICLDHQESLVSWWLRNRPTLSDISNTWYVAGKY